MADDQVKALADILLDCLCKKLAVRPDPPQLCCLRFGLEVTQDVTPDDVCCQGLGYVRIGTMFPSSQSFPEPDTMDNCMGSMWAVEMELGVLRCGDPGTCEEWNSATAQHISDRRAMMEALCCFKDAMEVAGFYLPLFIGLGETLPISGNCNGSTQLVTVQVNGSCCT